MVLELYHRLMMRGLNKEYSIQFPLKQEDIGDTLGLTTVHVNRTLHAFRDEGVLLIHKHELTILDYDMLHSLAGSTFKILAPEGLENPVEASKISSQVFKYKSPEDH